VGDWMCFYDKSSAYAPVFPIVNDFDTTSPGADKKPKLDSDYVTSWVGFLKQPSAPDAQTIT
jgi:hypothetical protein